ncbi:hypothetical protein M5X11_33230 [Paenibacillus alginolyticus]|uniref:Uncharacterized protein n=1 Tax=Paenibacillus alginolyticus TaxID=59839 RepID=A0ABT4G9C3_9BACL|nr:hypothetical protein [Paenibacillus alginolyticus]MCY9669721.1 hypothetical protein [Paenibacillus alginolyticus]MCY9692795.1 hypothetical protein [Paenibacillus alginolyticus]MEC0146115.1 hypothetical protein [Paenibacillus alginolyticus]
MQVHASDFDRLTALSFIIRSRRGWFIHDGLRKAMLQDFRLRKPQEYQRFLERSMSYLYRHFEGSGSTEERALYLSDLLYLL